ncbi:MAG: hypothetical protein WD426_07330 [Anditalea sp.]
MKSSENNHRTTMALLLEGAILLIFILVCVVSLYYNYKLQEQVYERDILIEKLTKRDSILNEIFEIKYDSVDNSISYTYQVRDGEVIKYNQLVEELFEAKELLIKTNVVTEKLKSVLLNTNKDSQYLDSIYDSLLSDYNALVVSFNNNSDIYTAHIRGQDSILNVLHNELDSLSIYRSFANLAKEKYNISFSIKSEGEARYLRIDKSAVDSAMILFPYYKDRLSYDKNKKQWIITFDKK